jgi:predicted nucleic acid-binding Zn ribbon protein
MKTGNCIAVRINKPGFLFDLRPVHHCHACGKPLPTDEEKEFYEVVLRAGAHFVHKMELLCSQECANYWADNIRREKG